MKRFLNWIPRKWKGYYLIWFSLHFILFMVGGAEFVFGKFFYPFYTKEYLYFSPTFRKEWQNVRGFDLTNIGSYDLSELFVYTLTPVLIALILFYLKPEKK